MQEGQHGNKCPYKHAGKADVNEESSILSGYDLMDIPEERQIQEAKASEDAQVDMLEPHHQMKVTNESGSDSVPGLVSRSSSYETDSESESSSESEDSVKENSEERQVEGTKASEDVQVHMDMPEPDQQTKVINDTDSDSDPYLVDHSSSLNLNLQAQARIQKTRTQEKDKSSMTQIRTQVLYQTFWTSSRHLNRNLQVKVKASIQKMSIQTTQSCHTVRATNMKLTHCNSIMPISQRRKRTMNQKTELMLVSAMNQVMGKIQTLNVQSEKLQELRKELEVK